MESVEIFCQLLHPRLELVRSHFNYIYTYVTLCKCVIQIIIVCVIPVFLCFLKFCHGIRAWTALTLSREGLEYERLRADALYIGESRKFCLSDRCLQMSLCLVADIKRTTARSTARFEANQAETECEGVIAVCYIR